MTKLRIHPELHARARECAIAIREPLAEWIRCAIIGDAKGRFDCVELDKSLIGSTYKGSVIAVYPTTIKAAELRGIIARGVTHAEGRRVELRTDILTEDRA